MQVRGGHQVPFLGHFPFFFFETESFLFSGTSKVGCLASLKDPPVSITSVLGIQRLDTVPSFYVGAGDQAQAPMAVWQTFYQLSCLPTLVIS